MRSKQDTAPTTTFQSKLGVVLRPNVRKALGRSIDYHAKMAEACKKDDPKLSETHTEAAKQLQELVDSVPVMTAIDVARARQTVRRVLH